jgi:hypothetical protein
VQGPQGPQGPLGPQGERGEAFKIDATGLLEERSQYDSQPKDFSFIATDNGNVYIKQSDASGDWSEPIPFKGDPGNTGAVYTPSVDAEGNISWTNNGELENPATVNIRGPQGNAGADGKDGYTPIRGTDYWTAADINEIRNYCEDVIMSGAW